MINRLERLALQRHLRIGTQRRIVLTILDRARNPLAAREIHRHAEASLQPVSLSTIRHTLSQLTAAGLLRRIASGGRTPRYEKVHGSRRDSLIDTATGDRLEFHSEGIEDLLRYAVRQLGYRLLDYQLDLFGLPEGQPDPRPARATERQAIETTPMARQRSQQSSGASRRPRRRRGH